MVRLFPPSAGGSPGALRSPIPGIEIVDPYARNPDSIDYDIAPARHTLLTNTALAAETDILIAYLPKASMGTAVEMWTAFHARKHIIVVTPLVHNWVINTTADQVLPDLDSLLALIQNGRFAQLLEKLKIDNSPSIITPYPPR
jgi:hypothetical protein